ncbi:MAG: nuclear transport factor 2 family protein [Acidobacteriaceae bacterium]
MSTATELRALEERLLQSDFRRNRSAVAELLAEDFREFGSSGRVWNRHQILDQLETEPPFQASLQDFEARELATGAVLVTYKVTVQRQGNENETSLRSSIWIRRDGHWQVVFHQGTPQIR